MREVIEEVLHVADGIVGERRIFAVAASDDLVAAAAVLLLAPRERKGAALVEGEAVGGELPGVVVVQKAVQLLLPDEPEGPEASPA